jgi:hypothetical protein
MGYHLTLPNSSAFEPSLCEPGLRFLGTSFLTPETKRLKCPLETSWAFAETKYSRASPPIRGFWLKTGKSPLDCDCVVGLGGFEPSDKHAVVSNLSPNGRCCDQMSLD